MYSRKNELASGGIHVQMQKTAAHMLGVVCIVGLILLVFGKTKDTVEISATAGGIFLTDPGGCSYEIIYEDISDIRLVQLSENYGKCLEGGSENGFNYGVWENEEWGRYFLCVREAVGRAVYVCQKGNIFIFNYEGAESTENFYKALNQIYKDDKEGEK